MYVDEGVLKMLLLCEFGGELGYESNQNILLYALKFYVQPFEMIHWLVGGVAFVLYCCLSISISIHVGFVNNCITLEIYRILLYNQEVLAVLCIEQQFN